MEYIKYGDLSDYITDDTREDVKEIATQVLEGLVVLHAEGICHRDLKPQVRYLQFPGSLMQLTTNRNRTYSSPLATLFGLKSLISAGESAIGHHDVGRDTPAVGYRVTH